MRKLLANLSRTQQITIAAVILAVIAGIYALVQHHKEADFKPLFTGLAPEDAASIVQKLKETGVEYRLPESGGIVLVPSARIPELRLTMAAAGIPRTGRIGFELFDKTNLGATEFTEHVNYRRALEGELERSVMSLAEVEQARVHVTFPKDSVFLDAQEPAKASVLVKIRPGAHLAPNNVLAINHLVASAVEGLSPAAVSVLDMNGNLLGRPKPADGPDGPGPSEAALEYRHKIEADLVAKINATLEPLLGANKFRAAASVECDFSGGEESEEIFDPSRSVMLTSQRTEDASGSAATAGVPGTASALPRPTSRPAGSAGNRVTRSTENITYQTSRTVRKTRLPAGTIKRISLTVLVDNDLTWQRDKTGYRRVLAPPGPQKLKVVHDLVAGIAGLNADRGDQLVVESLPFENTLTMEPPELPHAAAPQNRQSPIRWPPGRNATLIGAGVALVLIVAGIAVAIRLRRRKLRLAAEMEKQLPASQPAAPAIAPGSIEQQLESKLAEHQALQAQSEARALSALKLAPVITKTAEVLAKHLREKIKQEPEISAQVLRTWLHEDENG
jgi:flagellar M-ring protein FliF